MCNVCMCRAYCGKFHQCLLMTLQQKYNIITATICRKDVKKEVTAIERWTEIPQFIIHYVQRRKGRNKKKNTKCT